MVIIDTVVNTLFGGLTLDPAGMHCPSWDDAFVSSYYYYYYYLCQGGYAFALFVCLSVRKLM